MKYPTLAQINAILKQMEEKGIKLEDYESEYYHGEHITYYYNKEKHEFVSERMDVIAASYFYETIMTKKEMIDRLSEYTLYDFEKSGFVI